MARHRRSRVWRQLARESWRQALHSRSCFYCARPLSKRLRTRDHLVPKSQGGSDHPANLVVACAECNQDRTLRYPTDPRLCRRWWKRGLPTFCRLWLLRHLASREVTARGLDRQGYPPGVAPRRTHPRGSHGHGQGAT